jgi:hypothetical protein
MKPTARGSHIVEKGTIFYRCITTIENTASQICGVGIEDAVPNGHSVFTHQNPAAPGGCAILSENRFIQGQDTTEAVGMPPAAAALSGRISIKKGMGKGTIRANIGISPAILCAILNKLAIRTGHSPPQKINPAAVSLCRILEKGALG